MEIETPVRMKTEDTEEGGESKNEIESLRVRACTKQMIRSHDKIDGSYCEAPYE